MAEVKSLKDIKRKQWTKLRKAVEQANGKLIVLVHPYFEGHTISYLKSIEGLLKTSKTPILILEEYAAVSRTRKRLAKLNAAHHLILPTASADSSLIKRIRIFYGDRIADKNFDAFKDILKKAKVKSVFVGGGLTHRNTKEFVAAYERSWLPEFREPSSKPISDGCAGTVYQELIKSGEFKTRLIPKAVFPNMPQYPAIRKPAPRTAPKPKQKRRI